ncbi:MAG: hypothetical protein K0R18_281 [Bacillales bacterium]|nr:hypothetical protein [Bacillales bacterium]
MSDMRYGDASLRAREYLASKVKTQLNKNVTDYGLRFIKLTSLIPNWETYLTQKQRESAERYLKCFNAYDVDHRMKLSSGTTHQRLFGSKTSKGALGRLEEIYKMLENSGFFAEKQKRQEAAQEERKQVKLTQKTLDNVRELIKLVIEIQNYESYVTKQQAEKIQLFMQLRNFSAASKKLGITIKSYQDALIGDGGALERLRAAQQQRTVNSWDEV